MNIIKSYESETVFNVNGNHIKKNKWFDEYVKQYSGWDKTIDYPYDTLQKTLNQLYGKINSYGMEMKNLDYIYENKTMLSNLDCNDFNQILSIITIQTIETKLKEFEKNHEHGILTIILNNKWAIMYVKRTKEFRDRALISYFELP